MEHKRIYEINPELIKFIVQLKLNPNKKIELTGSSSLKNPESKYFADYDFYSDLY